MSQACPMMRPVRAVRLGGREKPMKENSWYGALIE
jgi:hypothetical protein